MAQRVWGRASWGKLGGAWGVGEKLGAKVVVVHPPFRLQRDYAREFEAGLTRMDEETDVVFAVEDLYPLRGRGAQGTTHPPHWAPVALEAPPVPLDLSPPAAPRAGALAVAGPLRTRRGPLHMAGR